ncbi:MAG: DUF427 domain-containing protein [Gammaproteobacteria bacterium]|nr:DUF427 domain-containing protein [Gammaproteobacteria bacterium]
MARAYWKKQLIAESDDIVELEGNLYFPESSLKSSFFSASSKTSHCPWKGTASYLDVTVDGETNAAAAWFYPKPRKAAEEIRDRVAFWRGIETEK